MKFPPCAQLRSPSKVHHVWTALSEINIRKRERERENGRLTIELGTV